MCSVELADMNIVRLRIIRLLQGCQVPRGRCPRDDCNSPQRRPSTSASPSTIAAAGFTLSGKTLTARLDDDDDIDHHWDRLLYPIIRRLCQQVTTAISEVRHRPLGLGPRVTGLCDRDRVADRRPLLVPGLPDPGILKVGSQVFRQSPWRAYLWKTPRTTSTPLSPWK